MTINAWTGSPDPAQQDAQAGPQPPMLRWRELADYPAETGRYIVAHCGQVGGHAYYTAREGDTHYPVGWAQLPDFKPTHWLDGPRIGTGDAALNAAPTPPAQQDAQAELPIIRQNKLLADALASCILASGIVRTDIDGLTGPQLLLFAEDLREMLETKKAQQDAQAVDGAIIDVLLPKLYGIVNELLEHEGKPIPKEAKIAARRILPPQFRHSFEHGKTHSTPTPPAQASEMSKVSWGVDWGLSGDRACASIVRRLPDGVIEVLATEIGPQINWLQRVAPIDWSQAGALMEAAASAKSAGFTTGTTNWAAHICRHMEAISARQKPSWARLPADDTEGGAA